jgi:Zn ribbon nucleic-acid-binding protein
MPRRMIARVTCPKCRTQFQAEIEQLLDVDQDPSATARLVNGQFNVAVCPACRTAAALEMPFMYHDAEKELALVYMPYQAGRNDIDRQKAIGSLTTTVMETLPAEKRKAYLLRPQVFLSRETLVKKVLEAEGITPEVIEQQKAKAELLHRLVEASSDDVFQTIAAENDAFMDDAFFQILLGNLEMARTLRQAERAKRLGEVFERLMDLSSEGKVIRKRSAAVEALREQPTRERLVDLLIEAEDDRTRELLITAGQPLLDYLFFQNLTSRIDQAPEEEKPPLVQLRSQILDVRDELSKRAREVIEARSALLRDLLIEKDPEKLARKRSRELDEAFFSVLSANLEEARSNGRQEAIQALEAVWELTLRLMQERIPPELRLFSQLMSAGTDEEVHRLLGENRALINKEFVASMEHALADLKESDQSDDAERLSALLETVRSFVSA